MDRLKHMKENLISCVQSQMCDLKSADTKELGEAVDMIKDLEEAIYYCTITKAMEEKYPEEQHHNRYYTEEYYMPNRMNDMRYNDRKAGRMYYEDNDYSTRNDYMRQYTSNENGMRDRREGTSPMYRKFYMEAKENHMEQSHKMKELENYMAELSKDVTEMIADSSPEEKAVLQQKLTTLVNKIK